MTLTLKDAIKELKQIFQRNNNVEFAYIFWINNTGKNASIK